MAADEFNHLLRGGVAGIHLNGRQLDVLLKYFFKNGSLVHFSIVLNQHIRKQTFQLCSDGRVYGALVVVVIKQASKMYFI